VSVEDTVIGHYGSAAIIERIRAGLARLGIAPDAVTAADLKPVDEFHIGGAAATRELLDQIALRAGMQVLDIGSGIGGTPRFVAETTGCSVTGVDLTPVFVEVAVALSEMVGLAGRTRFVVGSALDLPLGESSFDAALMLHVGMNIPDKAGLMAEAARVLRPGARFAVYDVMRTGDDGIVFPVPWSETPEASFLASPDAYAAAAKSAGFTVEATRDRRAYALDFFATMRRRMAAADGPPALGLHILLGETANAKFANMADNIAAGRFAPVEMILRAPG